MKIRKKAQRFISSLLSITLLVATMPMCVLTVNAVTAEFAGGSGTESDPYLIETKEQLNNVRNNLAAQYKMVADIMFTYDDFTESGDFYNDGQGWEPIGTDVDTPFTGVFEGNNHTISGLQINAVTDGNIYIGLFGYCQGTVRKLSITDMNISGRVTGQKTVFMQVVYVDICYQAQLRVVLLTGLFLHMKHMHWLMIKVLHMLEVL